MRSLFAALFVFLTVLAGSRAQAQNAELCEGLLDELLIAVDRGNAAVDRADHESATETFFWVEEAAGALDLSCEDFLPPDVLAWLADTRLSALVQVRQWDLAIDEAEACARTYGGQGYCWLRGAQAMRALDRPAGVERFLKGFEENRDDNLPSAFDDLAIGLERWLNRRDDTPENVTAEIGPANQLLLQRLLDAGGFDPGTPDGVVGPQTMEALTRFYERSDSIAPQAPLTLMSLSAVYFDFEPLLQDEPDVVAALEPARGEIEPFYEPPRRIRSGSGLLIGREGRVLTDLGLVSNCERIEIKADLPRRGAFPVTAQVMVSDPELGFAVLASGFRTGYWARFEPAGDVGLPTLEEAPGGGAPAGAESAGSLQDSLLIAGYPLYGPLSESFAARYAGGSLDLLASDLQQEWLGAPVTNQQGHLVALVTADPGATLSGEVQLRDARAIADALLGDALEVTQGKPEDPILSPSDQARLAQLLAVKVSCYGG